MDDRSPLLLLKKEESDLHDPVVDLDIDCFPSCSPTETEGAFCPLQHKNDLVSMSRIDGGSDSWRCSYPLLRTENFETQQGF